MSNSDVFLRNAGLVHCNDGSGGSSGKALWIEAGASGFSTLGDRFLLRQADIPILNVAGAPQGPIIGRG